MAHLWFSLNHDPTSDIDSCLCETCTSNAFDAKYDLSPFWNQGLTLNEGEKISLVSVKKALDIVMKKVKEIHQPGKLETLCGRVIKKNVQGSCSELPLPKLLRDRVWYTEYEEQIDGNYAEDYSFGNTAKNIIGILWRHLGCTIIRSRPHPVNQF